MDILSKIKTAGLVGRGGACFPVAEKWEAVQKASGKKKFVVCNAAEGEPGVGKDGYILENFPEKVVDGIRIALDFLGAEKAFVYINYQYYKKLYKNLVLLSADLPIEFFIKPVESGYVGGEESSILNAIEGGRIEPRLRPPFPTQNGLWGFPTLVNNVESFYNVSLVNSGKFKKNRFYTINGDCLYNGVFSYPDSWTIEKILRDTNNYPNFPFFVQIGGEASGEILNQSQLNCQVSGSGSISVYSLIKNRPEDLVKKWLDFFVSESCGKCTPCREGIYRLKELILSPAPDWGLFSDLLNNLQETSFCGLGSALPVPIKSYFLNVLATGNNSRPYKKLDTRTILKYFG